MENFWQTCSAQLELELTPQQYSAWIKPLVALDPPILFSQKGWNGGYRLARPAIAITILEVVEAIDVPFAATADWGYVRLRRPDYTTAKLKAWLKRMRDQDWGDAFVFFKHEDDGTGQKFAARFLELAA